MCVGVEAAPHILNFSTRRGSLSGQFYTLAALPTWKEPQFLLDRKMGRFQSWMDVVAKRRIVFNQELNSSHPACNLVTILTVLWICSCIRWLRITLFLRTCVWNPQFFLLGYGDNKATLWLRAYSSEPLLKNVNYFIVIFCISVVAGDLFPLKVNGASVKYRKHYIICCLKDYFICMHKTSWLLFCMAVTSKIMFWCELRAFWHGTLKRKTTKLFLWASNCAPLSWDFMSDKIFHFCVLVLSNTTSYCLTLFHFCSTQHSKTNIFYGGVLSSLQKHCEFFFEYCTSYRSCTETWI